MSTGFSGKAFPRLPNSTSWSTVMVVKPFSSSSSIWCWNWPTHMVFLEMEGSSSSATRLWYMRMGISTGSCRIPSSTVSTQLTAPLFSDAGVSAAWAGAAPIHKSTASRQDSSGLPHIFLFMIHLFPPLYREAYTAMIIPCRHKVCQWKRGFRQQERAAAQSDSPFLS